MCASRMKQGDHKSRPGEACGHPVYLFLRDNIYYIFYDKDNIYFVYNIIYINDDLTSKWLSIMMES